MSSDGWSWLNTTYACGGICVLHGLIIDACPIYTWMRGWPMQRLLAYLRSKKALLGFSPLAAMSQREVP